MSTTKSANYILDKYDWAKKIEIVKAMEEYASQFKQPDISENVEKAADDYASQFHGDYDNNCTEDAACNGFKAGVEWQSQQPIPTVDKENEFELLLMIKNELLVADKLPFAERAKATKEILEQFLITRK